MNKDTIIKFKKTIRDIRFRIYYLSIFRIKTFIRRKTYTFLKFNRPSSYPFVTGDGFRSLAQHTYDELCEIKHELVAEKDIVFVRADLLHTYFKKVHPKIKNEYILISHNSDENIDDNFTKYIDEKIIHWFAQNLAIEHPKCTSIPIGLQLRFYDTKNKVIELLKKYTYTKDRRAKIFYAFSPETNTKRIDALKALQAHPLGLGPKKFISVEEYYSEVSHCFFNASPNGNGIDCHRTWESLYLGTIPVLEKSHVSKYWENIGLPVLLIDSWSEILTMDESFLIKTYSNLQSKLSSPSLYMNYWTDMILKYKNE